MGREGTTGDGQGNVPRMVPTGGVELSEDRLRLVASQWESNYRILRRMDEISLGETEPATLFVWRPSQP